MKKPKLLRLLAKVESTAHTMVYARAKNDAYAARHGVEHERWFKNVTLATENFDVAIAALAAEIEKG